MPGETICRVFTELFYKKEAGKIVEEKVNFEPSGWQELMLVAASIKLGLFEALAEKPSGVRELAVAKGYDLRATQVLVQALAELGHLREEGGRYHVSEAMMAVAVYPGSPSYAPNSIMHSWNLMERWLTVPEVVRTGRQVERPYTKERRGVFIRSMHDLSRSSAPEVVGWCLKRKPDTGSVLDLGGGPGTYARLFAERGIPVTIVDVPSVLEMMAPELAAWPEITLFGADFNESLPEGAFDLVFMGNILHIYGPQENRDLLKRAREVLAPGGLLAIVDIVRGKSLRAALFAVTMLVNTDSGGTWTEEEYRSWLEETGYANIEIKDLSDRDSQLILADRDG